MPVPHGGTATAVASTGTYDAARLGIEGRSVREGAPSCQPAARGETVKALISAARRTTLPASCRARSRTPST